eukprot:4580752-Amphidinium_carterae.1
MPAPASVTDNSCKAHPPQARGTPWRKPPLQQPTRWRKPRHQRYHSPNQTPRGKRMPTIGGRLRKF